MNLRNTLTVTLTTVTLTLITLSVTGCARFNVGNGSTDYKTTKQLAPLNVPAHLSMRPQQSLYPAPIIDERALANAPNFSNKKGNRYELPRAQPVNPQAVQSTQFAVSGPQLVTDGNGNPLLKIDGTPSEILTYVQAAASAANLISKNTSVSNNQIEVTRDNQSYRLRLTPNGSSNTLGVYDGKNNYAAANFASDILNSIAQNWAN